MNSNYTEFKFPQIKAHPWNKVFRTRLPQEAIDLVSRMLAYSPERWVAPAASHSFRPAVPHPPFL